VTYLVLASISWEKETGVKTMNELIKRVYGIVLAFSVGVYINVVHGRYPLEVVELFG